MGTALSILSTDAREVNRESTGDCYTRPAVAAAATAAAVPYFKGGGGWRIGDRKGVMLPTVCIAAGNVTA